MTRQDIRTWAPPPPPRRRLFGRIVFWVLFGLAVAALVGCFAVPVVTIKPFTMPSDSMKKTVEPGDSAFVVPGDLRRGDIVVLRVPAKVSGTSDPFMKRLIGLPGDHVACCNASGRMTVNGKALNETYLYPRDKSSAKTFSVTLRPGQIWVMGDHRSISLDSREWGPVPESGVIGRVILVHGGSSTTAPRTPQTYVADGLAPQDKRYRLWVILALVAAASVALIVILTIFGTIRFVTRHRRLRRMAQPPRLPYALRPVQPAPPAAQAAAPAVEAAAPAVEAAAPAAPPAETVSPPAETAAPAPEPTAGAGTGEAPADS